MATFSKIDGAEPSTVTFSLASVTQDRNGVTAHQEIVTLGGSESTLAIAQVRAAEPTSTEWALAVRQVGLSTQALRVTQSTAADLNAAVIQGSTNWSVQVSTGAISVSTGSITVHQGSTVFSVQVSTGAISVSTGSVTVHQGSTNFSVQVSTVQGAVIVRSSAANALITAYQSTAADLNVTAAQGGTWNIGTVSAVTAVSSLAGVVRIAGNNAADGIVHVGDSTNAALRVNVVAWAAGGSTIVTVNGNASSNSSLYLPVRLTNGTAFLTPSQDYADGSTASNLAGPVLTFDNGTNATMRAVSLTNGLPVNIVAGSAAGSTLVTVRQSTASELQATARLNTSSGGAVEGSTASPAHTVLGLHVRQALSSLQSVTTFLTSSNSTALYALVSSVAGMRHKAYAYFVASTHTSPSTLVFMSSAVGDLWAVNFGSGSSGVTGANLTISPPGFLFATANQSALNCRIENASTQVLVRVSLSYFTEP